MAAHIRVPLIVGVSPFQYVVRMPLDHSLIFHARKFINAENVHRVNTWIFCYQMSIPESVRQKRYEKLLRDFVTTKNLMLGVRMQAKLARDRGIELRRNSSAIEEEIKRLL